MLRQFGDLWKLKFVGRNLACLLGMIAVIGGSRVARGGMSDETSVLATHAPPTVDGPGLQLPAAPTQLYFDVGFGRSGDLSSLPYVAGDARNLRFALGGIWRWRDFAFEAEVPFLNVTLIHVTQVVGGPPDDPNDVDQTVYSFGDVRGGATWTRALVGDDDLVGGFGLRTRLATHTAQYHFHVATADNTDVLYTTYVFPYYFHIAPTLILGGALGRFTFVMNQGALFFVGPDGYYLDQKIIEPTMVFWDAHYAVGYSPARWIGASVELVTTIQLNHVSGIDFQKFNDVRAVWLAPALQFHVNTYRIDVIGRWGTTRGENLLGVLEYVGERSITVRVGRTFN